MAERDENTARKPMLPTEAAALGMAIEEMEKPAAKARQGARTDLHSATGGGMSGHEARDVAAAAEAVRLPSASRAICRDASAICPVSRGMPLSLIPEAPSLVLLGHV